MRSRLPTLCVIALAACGSPEAPGPPMDDLSRKTLEAWHAKEHHLGRAGVKRARCALEVTLPPTPDDPKASRTTKGALSWDGEEARTRWEDEELGHEADHGDLTAEDRCSAWFEPWWSWPCFRKAKLVGKRKADGRVMIGFRDSEDEPFALVFDAEGVLATAEWGTGERRRVERLAYERRDGKCVLASTETIAADGRLVCKAEIRYEAAKGHLVPKSIRIVVAVESREEVSELRFTDWKLDDDAK